MRGLRDDFRTFNWEEIRVETELFFKTFVPLAGLEPAKSR